MKVRSKILPTSYKVWTNDTQTVSNKNLTLITGLEAANDLDIGSHNLKAETLESDVVTGTTPLTIVSETLVNNLNVDKVDGYDVDDTSAVDNEILVFNTTSGKLEIGSGDLVTQQSIALVTGKSIKVNGNQIISDQQSAITDASTSHSITDPADSPADVDALRDDLVANTMPDIESKLDSLGTTLNSILAILRTHGLINTW